MRNKFIITAILAASIAAIALMTPSVGDTKVETVRDPMPVKVTTIQIQDSFEEWRSFTGRAKSGRTSPLAFEMAGKLTAVRVDIGARVKKGQALATIDAARLKAVEQQIMADKADITANLMLAKSTLKRAKKTFAQGHLSEQHYDEATTQVTSLSSKLAHAEANLTAIHVDLDRSIIKAPYDGVITQRHADEGLVISEGTPILTIAEINRMEAHIGIQPLLAQKIADGSKFRLVNSARKTIKGSVRAVVPIIEGVTRTILITFNLDANEVADGELITVLIRNKQKAIGAWVPIRALAADVRGLWRLYRVNADNKITFENVQILYSEKENAFVSGTISDGAKIVSGGINKLAAGESVKIVNPTTNSRN